MKDNLVTKHSSLHKTILISGIVICGGMIYMGRSMVQSSENYAIGRIIDCRRAELERDISKYRTLEAYLTGVKSIDIKTKERITNAEIEDARKQLEYMKNLLESFKSKKLGEEDIRELEGTF